MKQTPENIYHIYVPSFCEQQQQGTPHKGIGTLAGIASKAPYIADLGASVVWLSPFFVSPRLDGGYDIADHKRIDPQFGNDSDFDALTNILSSRNMQVMIDIVPNHTSDAHAWFAASSDPLHPRHQEFHSYYIWKDPAPGSTPSKPLPPNNWASVFSKSQVERRLTGELQVAPGEYTPPLSAWHFHPKRGQFYLASFSPHQPDLNLLNGVVRNEVQSIVTHWYDRGVQFFRWDAVPYVGKDPYFRDEKPNPAYQEDQQGRPLAPYDNPYDQLLRENSSGHWPSLPMKLNDLIPHDRGRHILEAYLPAAELRTLDAVMPKNTSVFNFSGLDAAWHGRTRSAVLADYHAHLPADKSPNQVQGNHDKPYIATRIGQRAARASAVVQLTLPGDSYIYNGEEGGFIDDVVPKHLRQDPLGGRDGCRTPMLWNATASAGFSEADAARFWLPLSPHAEALNIADQANDPYSMFNLYKRLLAMRTSVQELRIGAFVPLYSDSDACLAFARRTTHSQLITIANTSAAPRTTRIRGAHQHTGRVVLSSRGKRGTPGALVDLEHLILQADEAIVVAPGS